MTVTFQKEGTTFGWENVKAVDESHCKFAFTADKVTEIPSGNRYKINGGCLKFGNQLKFTIWSSDSDSAPQLSYEFTVIKK